MFNKKITKNINHKAENIFNLVLDIQKYPEFLPWCSASRIIESNDFFTIADLVISFTGFREKYRSKITAKTPTNDNPNYIVDVNLVEGPFKELKNYWIITQKQDNMCEVNFEIAFSLNSSILNKVISVIFEKAFTKMIEAFENRANEIFKE